ncbi:Uncharacterised protein [Chromobacterium violaceum]|uniref:Uncharacterized protein n=1 Tax=Chromobacterium violaceum TaxID=536 RepID=A0A3S4LGI4_CHRVL|nr:Uncharacterised protein [Chromobacterium violaceum]
MRTHSAESHNLMPRTDGAAGTEAGCWNGMW